MSFDPINAMRAEGLPVDSLTATQRAVLSELTAEETATLISIQRRVDVAGAADVEGHLLAGIGIF